MARTPKGKKGGPGSNRADGGKKLRRKAAMQGKRMKKTLMALGGDDTKEEVRDLLNQSDISIIGAKAAVEDPPATPKTPQPTEQRLERTRRGIKKSFSTVSVKTKIASKEMANGIANGISNGITKTRSLRNLRAGQQRLENLPDDSVQPTVAANGRHTVVEPEKEKVVVANGNSVVANGGKQAAGHGDVILSKLPTLEGVKTLFSNTVWGVPYAKVLDHDTEMDISVSEEPSTEQKKDESSKCRIS